MVVGSHNCNHKKTPGFGSPSCNQADQLKKRKKNQYPETAMGCSSHLMVNLFRAKAKRYDIMRKGSQPCRDYGDKWKQGSFSLRNDIPPELVMTSFKVFVSVSCALTQTVGWQARNWTSRRAVELPLPDSPVHRHSRCTCWRSGISAWGDKHGLGWKRIKEIKPPKSGHACHAFTWDQTLAIARLSHGEGGKNLPKQTLVQTRQDQLLRRELK